jgi:hypothetical protein
MDIYEWQFDHSFSRFGNWFIFAYKTNVYLSRFCLLDHVKLIDSILFTVNNIPD